MLSGVVKMLNVLESPLNKLLRHPIAGGLLKVFLIAYASMVVPELPPKMLKMMDNKVIKIVILSLVIYIGTKDLPTAVLLAVAFMMTMGNLAKLETVQTVAGLLDAPIDVAQGLANDVIDGAQDLSQMAVDMVPNPVHGPVAAVASVGHEVVDVIQGVTNELVDGAQEALDAFASF